uniref:Uncharacterized protein n=1 Tax=Glossina pallidipes TaxID=7398 RepID=A0A1A9Z9X7_GLOPL
MEPTLGEELNVRASTKNLTVIILLGCCDWRNNNAHKVMHAGALSKWTLNEYKAHFWRQPKLSSVLAFTAFLSLILSPLGSLFGVVSTQKIGLTFLLEKSCGFWGHKFDRFISKSLKDTSKIFVSGVDLRNLNAARDGFSGVATIALLYTLLYAFSLIIEFVESFEREKCAFGLISVIRKSFFTQNSTLEIENLSLMVILPSSSCNIENLMIS